MVAITVAHSTPPLVVYVQVQRSKLFELKSAVATRLLINHICSFTVRDSFVVGSNDHTAAYK